MSRRIVLWPLFALMGAAVVCTACGGKGENESARPTMAGFSETVQPDGTIVTRFPFGCTGMMGVDAVIGAVLAHDTATLSSLVEYTSVPCSTQVMHGAAFCEQGETDGTAVDAFPIASVEAVYVRPEGIDAFVSSLTETQMSLYGIYVAPSGFWPPGDFVALFSKDDPGMTPPTEELVISGGKLVGAGDGLGSTPEQVVALQHLQRVASGSP